MTSKPKRPLARGGARPAQRVRVSHDNELPKLSIINKNDTVLSMVLERTLPILLIVWKLSLIAMIPYGISLLSSLRETVASLPQILKPMEDVPPPKAIHFEPLVLPALEEASSTRSVLERGKKTPH